MVSTIVFMICFFRLLFDTILEEMSPNEQTILAVVCIISLGISVYGFHKRFQYEHAIHDWWIKNKKNTIKSIHIVRISDNGTVRYRIKRNSGELFWIRYGLGTEEGKWLYDHADNGARLSSIDTQSYPNADQNRASGDSGKVIGVIVAVILIFIIWYFATHGITFKVTGRVEITDIKIK